LEIVGGTDKLFDLLATSNDFVNVFHHDALDLVDLLAHLRDLVGLGIVRVKLHALFQHTRKRTRVIIQPIRGVKSSRDVVEKRVGDAVRQCRVGHAQKNGRVVCHVVKILRFVRVRLARVDVERDFFQQSSRDLSKVARCRCEFCCDIRRTSRHNCVMKRHIHTETKGTTVKL
jgi:hypothetical protein